MAVARKIGNFFNGNSKSKGILLLYGISIASIPLYMLLGASDAASILFNGESIDETSRHILLQIRLPRIMFSVMAGAALALTGVIAQSLFRNPLAEPGLIGIAAGTMVFAVFGILIVHRIELLVDILPAGIVLMVHSLPFLFAFFGGILVSWLVLLLGRAGFGFSMPKLMLSGIAVNALAMSLTGFFIFIANDRELRDITFWSLGSYSAANWQNVSVLSFVTLATLGVAYHHRRDLDVLLLGEKSASDIGVHVGRVRWILLATIAFAQSAIIAFAGMINFIALVAPHLARLSFPGGSRFTLLGAAAYGAIISALADSVARTIVSPAEMPIGILTGLLGAPYFLYLVRKEMGNES